MRSSKFESILARHPRLRGRLTALAAYIGKQAEAGRMDIVPALAARSLDTSEAEVLGLLMLFEEQGLLKSVYQVYCADRKTLLGEFNSKEEIPEAIHCEYCGEDHCDPEKLEVELVFQLADVAWLPAGDNIGVSLKKKGTTEVIL